MLQLPIVSLFNVILQPNEKHNAISYQLDPLIDIYCSCRSTGLQSSDYILLLHQILPAKSFSLPLPLQVLTRRQQLKLKQDQEVEKKQKADKTKTGGDGGEKPDNAKGKPKGQAKAKGKGKAKAKAKAKAANEGEEVEDQTMVPSEDELPKDFRTPKKRLFQDSDNEGEQEGVGGGLPKPPVEKMVMDPHTGEMKSLSQIFEEYAPNGLEKENASGSCCCFLWFGPSKMQGKGKGKGESKSRSKSEG